MQLDQKALIEEAVQASIDALASAPQTEEACDSNK